MHSKIPAEILHKILNGFIYFCAKQKEVIPEYTNCKLTGGCVCL